MAYYEQSQIPASLLKHYVGYDVVEFTTIIGILLRFSLIAGGRDATCNMHRLVQLIVKQWLAASRAAAEWQLKRFAYYPVTFLVVSSSPEWYVLHSNHTPSN